MAVKSLTLSLAQINAAAIDAAVLAALSFDITDVLDVGGKAAFKTTIDAADATAGSGAMNLLVDAPLFGPTTNGQTGTGCLVTVAGTAGYDGSHELGATAIASSGGKLVLVSTTAIGATESTLTAALDFTKLSQAAFEFDDLPATATPFVRGVYVLGSKAAGATSIRAGIAQMGSGGVIATGGAVSTISNIDNSFENQAMNSGVNVTTNASAPTGVRTRIWVRIDMNAEAGKQLDDVTGLSGGLFVTVGYIESPGSTLQTP